MTLLQITDALPDLPTLPTEIPNFLTATTPVFGLAVNNWLLVGIIILLAYFLRRLVSRLVCRLSYRLLGRKLGSDYSNHFSDLVEAPLNALIVLGAAWLAVGILRLPSVRIVSKTPTDLDFVAHRIIGLFFIIALAWAVTRMVTFAAAVLRGRQEARGQVDRQFVPFFADFSKIVVVIAFGLIAMSSIFGLNVAAIIGGLGIGGLAVAFAAQETIANLLGSFTIFLDKPFTVGDTIESQGITGTVEKVGFRSTRIRTLEKSYLTVPNKNLVSNALNNITESSSRRANFYITFAHPVNPDALRRFTTNMQAALGSRSDVMDEPGVNLYAFVDMGVQLLVTYLVRTADYNTYLNVRQQINYIVLELAFDAGLHFASASNTQGTSSIDTGKPSMSAVSGVGLMNENTRGLGNAADITPTTSSEKPTEGPAGQGPPSQGNAATANGNGGANSPSNAGNGGSSSLTSGSGMG